MLHRRLRRTQYAIFYKCFSYWLIFVHAVNSFRIIRGPIIKAMLNVCVGYGFSFFLVILLFIFFVLVFFAFYTAYCVYDVYNK